MNNDLTNILIDMKNNGEESRDIPGIGTVMFVREGELPFLLFIPEEIDDTERLVVEANNCESKDESNFLRQAAGTLHKGYSILSGRAPVLVPLIPAMEVNEPYYQQLSTDMFYEKNPRNIPEEVNEVIERALDIIEKKRAVRLDDKVFMMGYSSSGVFAQRFALFHPERIDTLCVGGASGSMPIPTDSIEYPLGVGGLSSFDRDAYLSIKFRYYVGEHELVNLAHDRKDIVDGEMIDTPKPMHDMTFFPRSVNPYVGFRYRSLIGEDYFERVERLEHIYKELGADIESTVIEGKAHKDLEVDGVHYEGVKNNEDPIIDNAYRDSVKALKDGKKFV